MCLCLTDDVSPHRNKHLDTKDKYRSALLFPTLQVGFLLTLARKHQANIKR